jgi:hypothetical protein
MGGRLFHGFRFPILDTTGRESDFEGNSRKGKAKALFLANTFSREDGKFFEIA